MQVKLSNINKLSDKAATSEKNFIVYSMKYANSSKAGSGQEP